MEDSSRRSTKRRANSQENGTSKKRYSDDNDGTASGSVSPSVESTDPMEYLNNLSPLPKTTPQVRRLTKAEVEELERILEFRSTDSPDQWREDWAGNLALAEKDILNPALKGNGKKSFRQPLTLWAVNGPENVRLLRNLLRHVCSTSSVPNSVKKILGNIDDATPIEELIKRIRRASYDPQVLKEDGWTTVKSSSPQGATGGAHLIGDNIRCDGSDAVVIAYVHDSDIGDLWKALWIEDLISFDLEAEEVLEAKRKWERRHSQSGSDNKSRRSTRFAVSSDFTVKGIEHGIVLGASYSKGARPGVYWPARVMHASEGAGLASQGKRSSSKQKVDLVFLAPYWSPDEQAARGRRVESLSETGTSIFEANPLLQLETVEANDEMIKEYPGSNTGGLDISQLQMSFRFTGLPKSAFGRYLDAHRLAMGLKEYAKTHLDAQFSSTDQATAGLFETHPLAVQAPIFPPVVLHLPFSYILAQLPRSLDNRPLADSENSKEPVLKLSKIVDSMKPPNSWGIATDESSTGIVKSPVRKRRPVEAPSASSWLQDITAVEENGADQPNQPAAIESFVADFPLLNQHFSLYSSSPPLVGVLSSITRLLTQLSDEDVEHVNALGVDVRRSKLRALVTSWAIIKRLGEECLRSLAPCNSNPLLSEWRRAAERIYKYMVLMFSDGKTLGNGISAVLTDTRCNGHRTSSGCFERPVRLPAAIKGAKLAGAGKVETTRLITSIPDHYLGLVEEKIIGMAHSADYLKRMKSRCTVAQTDDAVLILTDDSEGEGGEDTSKCEFSL